MIKTEIINRNHGLILSQKQLNKYLEKLVKTSYDMPINDF